MICDECKKRPTKVHITRIINGQKTELSLCEECAKKYQKQFPLGLDPEQNFSIHKFLAGLLDDELEGGVSFQPHSDIRCPKCGLRYADFSVHGRLGCGECYGTFRTRIDPLLEKIHGSSVHAGKMPHNVRNEGHRQEIQTEEKLDQLRKELQVMISEERFEEAAATRDRIREIEAKIEGTF